MTTLTYTGADFLNFGGSASHFERAFLDPSNGALSLDLISATSTELEFRNPITGYAATVTGTGFVLSGSPGNEVPVAGTVTSLSFFDTTSVSFDGFDGHLNAEWSDLSWGLVDLFAAVNAISANSDFALLADLLNGGGPITLDVSLVTGGVYLFDVLGDLAPLFAADMTVIGGGTYNELVGGLGNDLIIIGQNTGDAFGGLIVATEGNDTIDFSDAGPMDGHWVSYAARVDGAFTFNLNAETNQSTIIGQNFTDTIIDFRALVLADGIGFGSGDGADIFNVTNAEGGFINILGAEGADQYNITLNGGTVRLSFRYRSDRFDLLLEDAPQGLVADLSQGMIFNDGFGNAETVNILEGTGTLEIQGTNNNDNVIGSDLNESFITEQGNDTIDGGAGNDRILYDRFGVDVVNVNLTTGNAVVTYVERIFNEVTFDDEEVFSTFIDSLTSIESVRGSRQGDDTLISADGIDALLDGRGGDDSLVGANGADTLFGDAGSDTLNGGAGNDSISGGTEADTINAGAGNDTVRGDNGLDLVFLDTGNDLFIDNAQGGTFGRDTVFAGGGRDTIQGGNGNDEFHGEDGNDVINGRRGDDLIDGGTGADTINAGDGNDTVVGGNGQDRVVLGRDDDLFLDNTQGGPFGHDTVFAGQGNDTIRGGGGDDQFLGEAGADRISGGLGSDTLTGGAGTDTFVFAATDATAGTDLIRDFALGTDVFELSGTTAGDVSVAYDSGANTVTVSVGGNDLAVLRGPADLSGFGVDDILFV